MRHLESRSYRQQRRMMDWIDCHSVRSAIGRGILLIAVITAVVSLFVA